MTTPNRTKVIEAVLLAEGGIADVHDGKGVTRFGQTPQWLDEWGYVPPSNAGDAAVNYEDWLVRTRLGEVCDRDETLGFVVVDFAVHSGLSTAVQALQRVLHVAADGALGPVTFAALDKVSGSTVAHALVADRARLVGRLLAQEANRKYARGWLNRIAAQIETLA